MKHHQDSSLREVVDGRIFSIPDYQRPYAWDRKQLEDLWEDLDLMGPAGSHYTGTLVLLSKGEHKQDDGESFEEREVVDGQQRLTSLLLLIDRLIRQLDSLAIPEANALAEDLRAAFGAVGQGWTSRPRIVLADDLDDYWQKTILQDQPTTLPGLKSGHRLLKQAAELFDQWLTKLVTDDPATAFTRLKDLANRVTSGLRFLVYDVTSAADVGVIFETLNDRGRDLTELEKIKNYLLYLARQMRDRSREQLVSHINSAWSEIFDNFAAVPDVNEDSVLRAHWITTQDSDSRRWKGTDSIKAQFPRARYVDGSQRLKSSPDGDVDPLLRLQDDIVGYVDTLKLCSLYARELHSQEGQFVSFTSHQAEAARASEKLRNTGFGLVRFYPILFGSRLAHPTDGSFYTEMVKLCETFAVRVMLIGQYRTHTGSSSVNRHGHLLGVDRRDPASALADIASLIRFYSNDEVTARHLLQVSDWYSRRGHKFLLYEYELSLMQGGSPPSFGYFLNNRKETTEHILPQTPARGSQWLKDFSRSDERGDLTHTLGNLMLTIDNSRYGRRDYAQKRGTSDVAPDVACYVNGTLAQEREVARLYEVWTPETIMQRQQKLAEWVLTRWPLPKGQSDEPPVTEDEVLQDEAMDDTAMDGAEIQGEAAS